MPIIGRGRCPIEIRRGGDGAPALRVWHNGSLLFDGTSPGTAIGAAAAVLVLAGAVGAVHTSSHVAGAAPALVTVRSAPSTVSGSATSSGAAAAPLTVTGGAGGEVLGHATVTGLGPAAMAIVGGEGVAGERSSGSATGESPAEIAVTGGAAGAVGVGVTVRGLASAEVAVTGGAGAVEGITPGTAVGEAGAQLTVTGSAGTATGGAAVTADGPAAVAVTGGVGSVGVSVVVTGTEAAQLAVAGGEGTASVRLFEPSGMTKSGTQTVTTSFAQIIGWVADAANYPGSEVAGNALVAQGGKLATLTASVRVTSYLRTGTISVQIKVNGVVAVTGSASSASSVTAVATGEYTVASGDLVTVEVRTSSGTYVPTVAAGAETFLRIL